MQLVDLISSTCDKDAPGVVTVYATVFIRKCLFSNMVSNGSGSALSVKSQSAAEILQSVFFFNVSKSSGGAIFFSESMAYIQGSSF